MRHGKDEIGSVRVPNRSMTRRAAHLMLYSSPVKSVFAFVCVGVVFLMLFVPYLVWKLIETRINGLLSETAIISRLGGMALREMFRDETLS